MVTADLYPIYCEVLARLSLQAGQQIVVALGGGVDSQTLLDLTDRYRKQYPEFRYLAIHLDHSFHPKSKTWAEFLRQDCIRRDFPFCIEPIEVRRGARLSLEEEGRKARYTGLAERTEADAVILVGQHSSDQIETFFLQLKRGAGPKGLAAMGAVVPFVGQRTLVRPLLSQSKDKLYAYGEAFGVQWIEDDTNYDTQIERNFLRHDIVPRLKVRWPSIETTVRRSAELCAEQEALLAELLTVHVEQRVKPEGLCLANWLSQSVPLQKAILRAWLTEAGARLPSAAVLDELIGQLQRLPQGKVGVEWGVWQLKRLKQCLVLTQRATDVE